MDIEYPKIETLFNRDPDNMKRVVIGDLRMEEFGLVNQWMVTEKIDGTNVRVILEPDGSVRFGGRTGNAQMPVHLLDKLNELFPAEKVSAAFDPGTNAVIFGEGYGPKIQKGGGDYADEPSFIAFDVAVISQKSFPTKIWWLNWDDVVDVANKLDVPTVPVLDFGVSLTEASEYATSRLSSIAVREKECEGIVCRTDPLLFTRSGKRLMWKLKARDIG